MNISEIVSWWFSNIFNNLVRGECSAAPESIVVSSPAPQHNALDIQISLSATGLQLAMSAQGTIISSMMINEGVPIVTLNTFLRSAIMPIIAAYGPWSSGYGLRDARVEFRVAIIEEEGMLTVTEATKTTTRHKSNAVIVEQMSMEADLSLFDLNVGDPTAPVSVFPPRLVHLADTLGPAASTELPAQVAVVIATAVSDDLHVHEPVVSTLHGKAPAPESSVNLRRSTRKNKYDGFKVPSLLETKNRASKVKPWVVPSAATPITITELCDEAKLPPPTPIPVIQQIGNVMRGISAAELSEEKLLACKDAGPSSDAA